MWTGVDVDDLAMRSKSQKTLTTAATALDRVGCGDRRAQFSKRIMMGEYFVSTRNRSIVNSGKRGDTMCESTSCHVALGNSWIAGEMSRIIQRTKSNAPWGHPVSCEGPELYARERTMAAPGPLDKASPLSSAACTSDTLASVAAIAVRSNRSSSVQGRVRLEGVVARTFAELGASFQIHGCCR